MRPAPFIQSLLAVSALLAASTCTSRGLGLNTPDTVASPREQALRVYIDCSSCDLAYITSEMTFVNHVRDRHDAQVHILVTRRQTGGGGREHMLTFIGQGEMSGSEDTLGFTSRQSDTEDMIRRNVVRVMKMGLMRFVARTPLAQDIVISYQHQEESGQVVDPWDSWVFKTSVRSYLNGEKAHGYVSLYGNISASRVTPDLKLRLSTWGDYTEDRFDIEDATVRSISRGRGVEGYGIFSLDDHWSAAAAAETYSSTYSNQRLTVKGGVGIEYNLFPYGESTRRQLRFDLQSTWLFHRYEEETIFDKQQEHLLRAELSAALELTQTWGSVQFMLEGSQYLHDFSKNRLEASVRTSLRLVEGLSLDVNGNYSVIHDQLSLAKSGASRDEVLLQRRQLATQYQYYGSLGLSYTFGSIYNNVVNPRFGDF